MVEFAVSPTATLPKFSVVVISVMSGDSTVAESWISILTSAPPVFVKRTVIFPVTGAADGGPGGGVNVTLNPKSTPTPTDTGRALGAGAKAPTGVPKSSA